MEFKMLEKGVVNRVRKVTIGIGGKGANTARMVTQLGGRPELIGFVGGANGRLIEQMLEKESVRFRHVEVSGETRICQTLVEAGNPEVTELVEEMPPLAATEWKKMVALFQGLELSGSIVPISGKLPAGAPVDAYAQIAKIVSEQGGQIILDAPGEPLLLALEYKPFMVKINDVELLQTFGGDDLLAACRQLILHGAQSVLITRGSRSAFFVDGFQTLEMFPPKIEAVNPVGSGDAVTAGIAVELAKGSPVSEAVITGMACGAANALHLISGKLEPDDVARLRSQVKSTLIG
ncbi:MAG: bifunctional hydroxymethylpyrimidine kinase/phosphomethylpyrimidine kinase [Kiritimatiellales bacterium]|nr:bifunctional hydroxymethylpyrimidine kinase/phosphomethylpyrimidine kinase [Kiritimatiellales bacterium]